MALEVEKEPIKTPFEGGFEYDGPQIDGEDLLQLPFFQASPPLEENPPVMPNQGGELLFAQAAGVNSSEEQQIKANIELNQRKRRAAATALTVIPQKPLDAMGFARSIMNAPLPLQTPGEAAATNIQRIPAKRPPLAEDIDVGAGKSALESHIPKNMGHNDSYKRWVEKKQEAATLALKLITDKDPIARAKYGELFGEEDTSFQDVINFMNPWGDEDPNGMDVEVWDAVKGIVSGDFDSEAFDRQMESNYGENWGTRFFAFAIKELAIDGGLLLLASTGIGAPLAATLALGRTTVRATKIAAAANRAIFVGVGGGSIQAGQNIYTNRDADLLFEIAVRTGAQGFGELAFFGGKAGYRYIKGQNRKTIISEVAKTRKIKSLSGRSLSKIFNGYQFDESAVSALVKAELIGSVDNYQKVMGEVAKGIRNQAKISEKEVREQLANVLGKDVSELGRVEMDIIVSDAVYLRDVFENARLKNFSNQDNASRGLGYSLAGTTIGHKRKTADILELYIDEAGVGLRHTDIQVNKSTNSMIGRVLRFTKTEETSKYAGHAGTNYTSGSNFSANTAKGFKKLYKDALGHLTKEEKSMVTAIHNQGYSEGTVYNLLTTAPQGMDITKITPRIIEAYNKQRFISDLGFDMLDKSHTELWRGRVKMINGNHIEILKNRVSKKGKNYLVGRKFDNEVLNSAGGEEVNILKSKWSSTPDLETIMSYRNGHVPRGYATHRHSVLAIDTKAGTVTREALFDSAREAEEFAATRRQHADPEKGQFVLKIVNNSDTGFGGFKATQSQMDLLSAVDPALRPRLQADLEAAGIPSKIAKLIFNDMSKPKSTKAHAIKLTELGTATTEAGKKLRIDHAKALARGTKAGNKKAGQIREKIKEELPDSALPTQEAIVEWLSSVAEQAGMNNFRQFTIVDFDKQFSKYLTPESTWANPVFIRNHIDFANNPAGWRELQARVETMSRWMARTFTRSTHWERRADHVATGLSNLLAERAAAGHIGSKAFSWMLDHSPFLSATKFNSFAKLMVAFPKLLFYNTPQTVIQLSQAIPSMGAGIMRNPVAAFRSFGNLPFLGVMESLHMAGKTIPRILQRHPAYNVWKHLHQSGYVADLTTTDTLFTMKKHLDPHFGRQMYDKLKQGGAVAFKLGEGGNRVVAWTVSHGQKVWDIKKYEKALKGGIKGDRLAALAREAAGFDGVPLLVKDIGSRAFLEEVMDRSTVTALNMARAGELELFSGFGSSAFQFRQVLPKTISIFDNTKMKGREKFGALGSAIAFWGFGAIPLAIDFLGGVDYAISLFKDEPADRMLATDAAKYAAHIIGEDIIEPLTGIESETTERFLRSGLIAALSEGDINFSNRVAMGSMLTDIISIQHPSDAILFIALTKDYFDLAHKVGAFEMLNPVSFLQTAWDVAHGMDIRESFVKSYKPDSIIAKALAGEISTYSFLAEMGRESGKIFSQIGAFSRAYDATHLDVVLPELGRVNPQYTPFFISRNKDFTTVPVTSNRIWSLVFGILPGKLVDERTKKEREFLYKNAAISYLKKMDNKIRGALGSTDEHKDRIIEEFAHAMEAYGVMARDLSLDLDVTMEGRKIMTNRLMGMIFELTTGGQLNVRGKITRSEP